MSASTPSRPPSPAAPLTSLRPRTRTSPGRPSITDETVVTVIVFAWGLFQAFWNLGAANFNADEPIYQTSGWAYLHGDFALNREHPPTAKYLIGLAQLVFGEGELSARIAVSVLTVCGGLIIWLWLRREIGWQGALFAAAGWMLLPHGVSSGVRLDRFAVLEPFMAFFAIAAFAAGWRWFRTRSYLWLVLSAVAMALSVTSKVSSAVLAPAILLLPLAEKRVRDTLLGGLTFAGVFAVVAVVLYLPLGVSGVSYMLANQAEHNAQGHSVNVGGVVYQFPPWWANLVFTVDGMGVAATLLLVVAGALAFTVRPRILTLYVATGLGLLLVFYLGVSTVALPHYYYAWVWLLCVLAGIGFSGLLARRRHRRRGALELQARRVARARRAARWVAVALVGLLAACAIWTSVAIARERPSGIALVLDSVGDLPPSAPGSILVAGMAGWEYPPYLDAREVTDPGGHDILAVVTRENVRFPIDAAVTDYLRTHEGELRPIMIDDVTVWIDDRAVAAAAAAAPASTPTANE